VRVLLCLPLLTIGCLPSFPSFQGDDGGGSGADGGADGAGDGGADGADVDADGDGYSAGVDCDDADADVYPGAAEVCGGGDEDCDGATDEPDAAGCALWYEDADLDTFGGPGSACLCAAATPYTAAAADDCDDGDPATFPGATPVCNDGVAQSCDLAIDAAACTWGGQSLRLATEGEGHRVLGLWLQASSALPVGATGVAAGLVGGAPWLAVPAPDAGMDGAVALVDLSGASPDTWAGAATLLSGAADEGRFGSAVAWLPGLRADERVLAVSAPGALRLGLAVGAVFVYVDPTSGGSVSDRVGVYGTLTRPLPGPQIRPAGDMTGDGVADLLLSSVDLFTADQTGTVWLLEGPLTSDVDLTGAPLMPAIELRAGGGDPGFGAALTANGDIDGDGLPDAAFAQPPADGGSGAAWLLRGADGLSDGSALSDLPKLRGPAHAAACGTALAFADPDGDGLDQLLVGCPTLEIGGEPVGGVVLVPDPGMTASTSLSTVGDLLVGSDALRLVGGQVQAWRRAADDEADWVWLSGGLALDARAVFVGVAPGDPVRGVIPLGEADLDLIADVPSDRPALHTGGGGVEDRLPGGGGNAGGVDATGDGLHDLFFGINGGAGAGAAVVVPGLGP